MTTARLALTREQILAYRRTVGALDERLPPGPASLGRAAWAGLQDSVPRAAVISLHARVHGTGPDTWEDPSLAAALGAAVQRLRRGRARPPGLLRGSAPDHAQGRRRAEDLARRLHAFLDGRRMAYGEAGRGLGVHPNSLRYAAATGTVLIRWDGARQVMVWTVPPPDVDPRQARLELARRYLHVFGPATPAGFARWAGIRPRSVGRAAFEALVDSLTPARTPAGDAWILSRDEPTIRDAGRSPASARLLPSGDAYTLLQGADRELLVPDPDHRRELWTPRVWPGAVLVAGEIVGTWRRAQADVTIESWRPLSVAERAAVEAEAASLPLPGVGDGVRIRWDH